MKSILKAMSVTLLMAIMLLSGVTASHASGSDDASHLSSTVIDGGNMFSPEEELQLVEHIQETHSYYDIYFIVETIPSLNGKNLEKESLARANELEVGEADSNNGVLIYISRDDQKVRFELERGISSRISNVEMKKIIDSQVTSQFKKDQFSLGVMNGMTSVGKKYLGKMETVKGPEHEDSTGSGLAVVGGITLLVLAIWSFLYFFGPASKERKSAYQEQVRLQDSIQRVLTLQKFARSFKYSSDAPSYKKQPDEASRLKWLDDNKADIYNLLKLHYTKSSPTARMIDREFYDPTNGTGYRVTDWFRPTDKNTDALLAQWIYNGTGFEKISIDDANSRIRKATGLETNRLNRENREKERARKFWNSLPSPLRAVLQNVETPEAREKVLKQAGYRKGIDNYLLFLPSFFSITAAPSNDSPNNYLQNNSSSSSNSSSSPSNYDGGNTFGGGSFDGGGGSGSW